MIRLETAEAGLDGIHDVSARGAHVVAAGADAAEDLGGDHDVLAGDVQVLEGLTKCLFAFAFSVNVSRVEEIDAGIDRGFNELVGSRLVHAADGLPEAAAASEGHRAEAEG